MRNLKKLMAVILTIAVVLSYAIIPSFAASMTDAQIVTTLGMIEGTGQGVTDEYLASTPQRYQAAKMFLVLLGLYEEALDYEGTANFADAEELQWVEGRNMLAYLWANKDLGFAGYLDGTFRPYVPITAQQYYKLVLTALGYQQDVDFSYDETLEFAADLGLGAVADADPFTINDLATATVEALTTKVKGSSQTLIAKLVEDGVVDAEVAELTGIYKAPVKELAVEDVEADNLIQIKVTFNDASLLDADKAEDVGNYKLVNSDGDTVEIADAAVKGNVVTLTLKASRSQQDKLELTIKDKILPKAATFDVQFLDTTIPTVVGAEVVGNDTIKVIFSEPMTETTLENVDNYQVDGGDLYIASVTAVNNGTEANIELYSDLEEGEVSVKVKAGVEDYAGFGVIPKTVTVKVVEDKEAPYVVGYKDATPNGITLIFNEDIEIADGDAENFYHTNTNNPVDADVTNADVDGKYLKLKFTDNNLPEGTAYVYIAKGAVNDLWDNKNAKIQVKVEIELDTTKPVLDKLEVIAQDEILLTFSEDIADADEDNFKLLDENGKEIKDIIDDVILNGDEITITFDEDLNGDYTLVIEDLEDLAGNVIADTTVDFTVDDMEAPVHSNFTVVVYKAGQSGQKIKVNFGEKMATEGKYSVTDLEKYAILVDGEQNDIIELADAKFKKDIKITVVDGGKAVEISIPHVGTEDNGREDGYNVEAGSDYLRIARVADAAGNYTKAFYGDRPINGQGTIQINAAKATAKDTIVVEFSDSFKTFDSDDIELYKGSGPAAIKIKPSKKKTSINSDGNTVVTFTLMSDDKLGTDAKLGDQLIFVKTKDEPASVNKYGEKLEGGVEVPVADKIAPELAKRPGNKGKDVADVIGYVYDAAYLDDDLELDSYPKDTYYNLVVLTFTEKIDATTVARDDFTVEKFTVGKCVVNGKQIILVLKADTDTFKAGLDVTQKAGIKDMAGNEVTGIDVEIAEIIDMP